MQLLDEDIKKFQELYKSHFGMDISRQEALEKGTKLVRLMQLVYKPMTQEEYDLIQKHRYDTLPHLLDQLQHHEPRITYDPRSVRKN